MLFVHQRRGKFQPDVVVLALGDLHRERCAVAAERNREMLVGQIKAVVQHVGDGAAVEAHQNVALADARFFPAAVRMHRRDFHHFAPSFAHIFSL